ncbi:MAG TPA: tetratricopeptide repeat protein [Thermoplasmata archaeon]|nr:tetratricopeptide repeat protein [Thermoplasmata archaeon]
MLKILASRLKSAAAGKGTIVVVTGGPGAGKTALLDAAAFRAAAGGFRVSRVRALPSDIAAHSTAARALRPLGLDGLLRPSPPAPIEAAVILHGSDVVSRRERTAAASANIPLAGMIGQASRLPELIEEVQRETPREPVEQVGMGGGSVALVLSYGELRTGLLIDGEPDAVLVRETIDLLGAVTLPGADESVPDPLKDPDLRLDMLIQERSVLGLAAEVEGDRGKVPRGFLYASVVEGFRAASSSQPIALLVDDAHLCDPASASLLVDLERAVSDSSLLVVLACRGDRLPGEGAISALIQVAGRSSNTALMRLDDSKPRHDLRDSDHVAAHLGALTALALIAPCDENALGAALDVGPGEALRSLEEIARLGLAERGPDGWALRSGSLEENLSLETDQASRARLIRPATIALDRRHRPHGLSLAGSADALPGLLELVEEADRVGEQPTVARLISLALQVLPAGDESRFPLLLRQARAVDETGYVERALRLYEEAYAASPPDDRGRIVAAAIFLCARWVREKDALHWADRAARDCRDPESKLAFLTALSWVDVRAGRLEQAAMHLEEGAALADHVVDRGILARFHHYQGNLASYKGEFEDALLHYRRTLDLRRLEGDLEGTALALGSIGNCFQEIGEDIEAVVHTRICARLLELTGNLARVSTAIDNLGQSYMRIGKVEEAIACFHRGRVLAVRTGDLAEEVYACTYLVEALMFIGQVERMAEPARRALEAAEAIGSSELKCLALVAQARYLLARGDAETALEVARNAMEHGTTPPALGEATLRVAEAEQRLGRHADALGHLESLVQGRIRESLPAEVDLDISLLRCEILADLGRWDEASTALDSALGSRGARRLDRQPRIEEVSASVALAAGDAASAVPRLLAAAQQLRAKGLIADAVRVESRARAAGSRGRAARTDA